MRFLSFHVNSFSYTVTKKGRSKILEELNEKNKTAKVENALVLFIASEKTDELDENIFSKFLSEIEKIVMQLKVNTFVLIPFAHLFGELSALDFAFDALKKIEDLLTIKGYDVIRMPFGWFSEFSMHAKGHPLSRIARIIK
ncbi:threonyl-tRNA synthetase editing domain-containing protein [Candidatus Harpocratesius sp.]